MIARILVAYVGKVYEGRNDRGQWRIRRVTGVVDLLTESGELLQTLPNADVSFRNDLVDQLDQARAGMVVVVPVQFEPRYGAIGDNGRIGMLGYQLWAVEGSRVEVQEYRRGVTVDGMVRK